MNKSRKVSLFAIFLFSSTILMGAFSAIDFTTQVSNKPTTLSGYGITDAVSSVTGTSPVVSSGGTTPVISMAAATTSTAGHMTAAHATALAAAATKLAAAKRETKVMSVASTTVTFTGTPVPSTIDAAVVAINGLIQPEGTFTRTSNKIIVSTAGTIPSGASVTILNLE